MFRDLISQYCKSITKYFALNKIYLHKELCKQQNNKNIP